MREGVVDKARSGMSLNSLGGVPEHAGELGAKR